MRMHEHPPQLEVESLDLLAALLGDGLEVVAHLAVLLRGCQEFGLVDLGLGFAIPTERLDNRLELAVSDHQVLVPAPVCDDIGIGHLGEHILERLLDSLELLDESLIHRPAPQSRRPLLRVHR